MPDVGQPGSPLTTLGRGPQRGRPPGRGHPGLRGRGASSAAGSATQAEANAKALADYRIPKKGEAPVAVTGSEVMDTHSAPPVKIEPIPIPDGALMVKDTLPLFFEEKDKE